MSLVGSLEDLGLGDILQIVSLSRKSGLLLLRSDTGEGRIVLCDGLVRGAFVKGEPEDLRGILVGGGFVDEVQFDECVHIAAESGRSLGELLCDRTGQTSERLDSLRREHVERAVLRMFTWRSGEFSFEVREEISERDRDLLLPKGINAQYLTMEATRLGDESGAGLQGESFAASGAEADESASPNFCDDEPLFSGEDADAEPEPIEMAGDALTSALRERESHPAHEALALAALQHTDEEGGEDADEETGEIERPAAPAELASPLPLQPPVALVAIDPDLAALEWLKASLSELFARIHIFQDSEGGMARIRQYLARAQRPLVLLAAQARGDGIAGAHDSTGLVQRLKTLAPGMPVLMMHPGSAADAPLTPGVDAVVTRPPTYELAERKRWSRLESAAEGLRESLVPWAEGCPATSLPVPRTAPAPAADHSRRELARLKQMSERLRDPSGRGDVLAGVLEYASECFSRVAIFMVRDDTVHGIAQLGLDRAGGPDDNALQQLEVPALETDGFRSVIEEREAQRFSPSGGSGRRLAELLGTRIPAEAYVAPIESGGRVAALLYADHLPDETAIGDTTALEIVLHEAGLALDRALLERALAEAEARSESHSDV